MEDADRLYRHAAARLATYDLVHGYADLTDEAPVRDKERAAVVRSLQGVRKMVHTRNDAFKHAWRVAHEHGLTSPTGDVYATKVNPNGQPWGRTRPTLVVDGERWQEIDERRAIFTVITGALAEMGIGLRIAANKHDIEPYRIDAPEDNS